MFEISDLQDQKYPIKVWLSDRNEIEDECLRQVHNLSKLPFLHNGLPLCLMFIQEWACP